MVAIESSQTPDEGRETPEANAGAVADPETSDRHGSNAGAGVAHRPFPGELGMSFAQAVERLGSEGRRTVARHGALRSLLGLLPGALRERVEAALPGTLRYAPLRGSVGQDGFRSTHFDSKLERERRYGEVYSLTAADNGFRLRFEFPRQVPPSAIKEQLGVPDEMPDYDYEVGLHGRDLIIRAHLRDENLRRVAAVSPAFPPDIATTVRLPAPVCGFKHHDHDRVLDVVCLTDETARPAAGIAPAEEEPG